MPATPTASSIRQIRILDAAERRFLSDGFERCSMDSIANDAHVSKREIYASWPGKEDLFIAIANRIFGETDVELPTAAFNVQNMLSSLSTLAQHLFDIFLTERSKDLFRASIVSARRFPELASDLHMQRITAWKQFSAYFEELIDRKAIKGNDAQLAANRFGSLVVEGAHFLFEAHTPSREMRMSFNMAMVRQFLNGYVGSQIGRTSSRILPEMQLSQTETAPPETGQRAQVRMSPEKRALMLDAILQEFLEKGYHRANLATTAASVGVSKATIYRQYGSKEGVFEHVVRRKINQLLAEPLYASLPGETFETAITRLCRRILDRHLEAENIALQRVLIEEIRTFPALSRSYYNSRLQASAGALRATLKRHSAAEADDLTVRAFHVLATFGSRYLSLPHPPSVAERDFLSSQAADIFLHGVGINRDLDSL